jgi:diacylglycerol O-acyltransferase / wax synthase
MAQITLSRRLSARDAWYLYTERADQANHVGGCLIYDGHLSSDRLIEILLQRLHLLPRYRQRVIFPPFGAAHPTWENDPDFDIRSHVEAQTLPPPGDDRVLSEIGGRLFAPTLDRGRPLWKLILLHGRPDGRTAMIWKVHHAMVDAISIVDLTMVLHDVKPDAEPPAPPPTPWEATPLPDPLTLLQDAVRDQLTEAAEGWAEDAFRRFRPEEATERERKIANAISSVMALRQPAPPTPFNGPLSGERQFAWVDVPLAEVRAVKSVLGGTVNDLVLAVVSGALGRYLRHHGYRTDGVELRAVCPVSVRRPDQRGLLGNLHSTMIVPLHVGILDPVERLAAARAAMDRLKGLDQAGGLYLLGELTRVAPAWQAFAGQFPATNTLVNTVASNVPGPQIPLYLGGHRLRSFILLGHCVANMGLFVAVMSYHQTITYGLLVDPTLVPDCWDLADCLRESSAELKAAAERDDPATFARLAVPAKTAQPSPGRRAREARVA